MLRIRLTNLEAQPDAFRNGTEEVSHYRRVRLKGMVMLKEFPGEPSVPFTCILDLRARLLSIRGDDTLSPELAHSVGEAIVHEMAVFTPRPIRQLLIPTEGIANAEWMTTDAEHVNGLLHRLKELKEFDRRPSPPAPLVLREIHEHLINAVLENQAHLTTLWDGTGNLRTDVILVLDTARWDAHRSRFIDLAEDQLMREGFVVYFEMVRRALSLWDLAIMAGKGGIVTDIMSARERAERAMAGPALSQLRALNTAMTRLSEQLVNGYGTEEQYRRFGASLSKRDMTALLG